MIGTVFANISDSSVSHLFPESPNNYCTRANISLFRGLFTAIRCLYQRIKLRCSIFNEENREQEMDTLLGILVPGSVAPAIQLINDVTLQCPVSVQHPAVFVMLTLWKVLLLSLKYLISASKYMHG